MIPVAPTLIEGWWRHQDSQGQRSHAIRTLPGQDMYVITLCGQVWLRDSLVNGDPPSSSQVYKERIEAGLGPWFCRRCLKTESKWRAQDAV